MADSGSEEGPPKEGEKGRGAPKLPALDPRFRCMVLGYPHVMPGLRGDNLRELLASVSAGGCCVTLDVNEA